MWFVHSLLSFSVLETGADKGTSEALKAAAAGKWQRRQETKFERKIQSDCDDSDTHNASIGATNYRERSVLLFHCGHDITQLQGHIFALLKVSTKIKQGLPSLY